MKNKAKKIISFILGGVMLMAGTACGGGAKELVLPDEEGFIETTTWNDAMMEAYLKPYWYSREIYNETLVFIGEEGTAQLMFEPSEIESVRNFGLDKEYVEGVDYTIEGKTVKRLQGSSMPYWEVEDYFLLQPNSASASISVDMSKLDFELEGQRFLRYGEGATFTSKQIAVTYRHDTIFDGKIPTAQQEKLESFLSKLENNEPIKMMVYGDSVGVGCNASGTVWGGNVSPYMPDAWHIVKEYLTKYYDADITLENQAVGGWKLVDCLSAYDARIKNKDIDLMILLIGGNDGHTMEANYAQQMMALLDRFFAEYPDANVILVTPDLPNEQSTWTLNVDKIDGWTANILAEYENADKVAVADVQAFGKWLQTKGKKGRDWLANNINHGNDFIIRVYAQYILKTMLGNDYVEEMYK